MLIKDQKIQFDEFPNFLCPKCNIGILRIEKDSIIYKYPSWIENLPDNGEMYYDVQGNGHIGSSRSDVIDDKIDEYITTLFLKCDNEKCNEVYSSCGLSKNIETVEVDDEEEL